MEESFFPRPEVSGELNKVVEARLHTDRPSPFLDQILALQKRYSGSVATPVYVITDPATEEVISVLKGARDAEFANFVHQATTTVEKPDTGGGTPPR